MTVWYKVDPNRCTYGELWRSSGRGSLPFAQAVYRKWLNRRLPATSAFAIPESPELVEVQSVPERPREVLGAIISQAERHGLRFAICLKDLNLGNVMHYLAVLLSADGATLGNVAWVMADHVEEASFGLGSRVGDRRLLTQNDPYRSDSPPEFDVWHLPGKSIEELVAIHASRLDRLGRERVSLASEDDIVARVIENQRLYHAFNLARGFYVPLTQEEVERLSGIVTADIIDESGNPFQASRKA